MSRGPGRWQRAVLEAVEAAGLDDAGVPELVTVSDIAKRCIGSQLSDDTTLTPGTPDTTLTRAQGEAIRRAMRTLATSGRVTLWTVSAEIPREDRGYGFKQTRSVWLMAARRPFTAREQLIHARRHAENRLEFARLVRTKDAYDEAVAAQEHVDELEAAQVTTTVEDSHDAPGGGQ